MAFGESRAVSWSQTVTFRGARYSIPRDLGLDHVWVRSLGAEVIIVSADPSRGNVTEVARHIGVEPGQVSLVDSHYAKRETSPASRAPKAKNSHEAAFLSLGHGAHRWLIEAGAIGCRGIEAKMSEAVRLSALHNPGPVDEALGIAALAGRFASGDLISILNARGQQAFRADTDATLQPGTSSWEGFGQ